VKLDTSPRSSTVEARMDQFALPLSFTPMPPTARSSPEATRPPSGPPISPAPTPRSRA
jgi:hypothetical protein